MRGAISRVLTRVPTRASAEFCRPRRRFRLRDEEQGLSAAERAFRHLGLKTERIVRTNSFSLFSERNRISEMAVYIVHASLLLIFLGGIVDALYGWRGFLMLSPGTSSNQIELRNGGHADDSRSRFAATAPEKKPTPTALRRSGGRSWPWSMADAKFRAKKSSSTIRWSIRDVRFYQASYGRTGKLDQLILNATPANGSGAPREISLAMNQTVELDADTSVQLVEFIPDFVVQDGQVYARSKDVANPAVHMIVTSKKANHSRERMAAGDSRHRRERFLPLHLRSQRSEDGLFHRLQVSHEPGQWAVWAGVVLMAIGLTFVFYVVHMRFWVVPGARRERTHWCCGSADRPTAIVTHSNRSSRTSWNRFRRN